jgi:hypothetical protein
VVTPGAPSWTGFTDSSAAGAAVRFPFKTPPPNAQPCKETNWPTSPPRPATAAFPLIVLAPIVAVAAPELRMPPPTASPPVPVVP